VITLSESESIPPITPGLSPPIIFGNGALMKFANDGGNIDKVVESLTEKLRQSPSDASLMLDLALLHLIQQRPQEAYQVQARALELQQLFRVVGTKGMEVPVRRRVLALVAPGDFLNNAQLEFLLDGSEIGLDVLYIIPGKPLPAALPEHDVVFCAVNESDENLPILRRISGFLPAWPRPALNQPDKIAQLSRDGVAALFTGSRKICAPPVRRVGLSDLRLLAGGGVSLDALLPGASFPVLARSVGSHCGENFEKLDTPGSLLAYLKNQDPATPDFFLSQFIDYRGRDGLFRKYRITLIERVPYICHMALTDLWKIHYVNAGMTEDPAKRAEEALAMKTFDTDFARRHRAAFAELSERIGLDYFGIDCSELPDGRFLLFEAETAMIIHNMDSPTLHPYKPPQMARVFAAFLAMIDRAAVGKARLGRG
jgi:hypothetical protein